MVAINYLVMAIRQSVGLYRLGMSPEGLLSSRSPMRAHAAQKVLRAALTATYRLEHMCACYIETTCATDADHDMVETSIIVK